MGDLELKDLLKWVLAVGLILFLLIFVFTWNGFHRGELANNQTGSGQLCSNIPEPYRTIFTNAGEKYNIQPAFLAAVFAAGEHQSIYSTGKWPEFVESPTYGTPMNPKLHNCGPDYAKYSGHDEDRKATSEWGGCIRGPAQMNEANWSTYGEGDLSNIEKMTPAINAMAHKLSDNGASGNTTDAEKLKAVAGTYNGGSNWEGKPASQDYAKRVMNAYDSYYCATIAQGQCAQKVVELAKIAVGDPSTKYYSDHDVACSAFTTTILKKAGAINYTETVVESFWNRGDGETIIAKGGSLNLSILQPGDVVFFTGSSGSGRYFTHVGIYIGNDRFINNSSEEARIVNSPLSTGYWKGKFAGAKRYCQQELEKPAGSLTVVLDPGHPSEVGTGASNTAAGVTEIHINWQVAQKTKTILEKSGVKVVLTKSSENQKVTNEDRAKIANDAGAALFFRIHAEGTTEKKFFMMYPDCIGSKNGVRGPPESIIAPSKQASDIIAASVAKSISGLKIKNDGVKADSIGGNANISCPKGGKILAGSFYSKVPTSLIEMIGLADKNNAILIADENNQQKMAQGIANGILEFLGK